MNLLILSLALSVPPQAPPCRTVQVAQAPAVRPPRVVVIYLPRPRPKLTPCGCTSCDCGCMSGRPCICRQGTGLVPACTTAFPGAVGATFAPQAPAQFFAPPPAFFGGLGGGGFRGGRGGRGGC